MDARTLISTTCAWAALTTLASAQCSDWQQQFGLAGANDEVRAHILFDDGSGPALYVGGAFTAIGDDPVRYIAKWNGSGWSPVGGGVSGGATIVQAFAIYDDGSGPALIAGGRFTTAGSVAASNIAKWDGTSWSPLGSGIGGPAAAPEVRCLATFDEGTGERLFVGGDFSTAGGASILMLARWDGASWSNPGPGSLPYLGVLGGPVHALVVGDIGGGPLLYVGGSFTSVNGVTSPNLIAWNGSAWAPVTPVSSQVRSLAIHDDGTGAALYLAIWGNSQRVLRWDGVASSVIGNSVEVGAEPVTLASFDDGVQGARLFVGTTLGSHPFLQVWDGGTSWSDPLGPRELDKLVRTLGTVDLGAGPRLFVGGQFTAAGPQRLDRLALYDGAAIAAFGTATSLDARVVSLASFDSQNGPELFAGGRFTFAGMEQSRVLGAWNGVAWSDTGLEIYTTWSATIDSVRSLVAWNDGSGEKLFAGGSFSIPGPQYSHGLAAWDGTQWSLPGLGVGAGGTDYASVVRVADDGSGEMLYVGGYFIPSPGSPASRLTRFNGTSWVPFPVPYSGGEASSIASFQSPAGRRVVVGSASPSIAPWVLEWNGSTWSTMNGGTNGRVDSAAAFDDGSGEALYVGGQFTTAGGFSASNIARWNGTSWTPLANGITGRVFALEVFDDGTGPALYAGGSFTGAGSVAANNVARWDGSQWSALGAGVDGTVTSFAVHDDGSGPALFAGGEFRNSGGVVAHFTAKWSQQCSCAPAVAYCTSGTTSNGCVPTISGTGMPSASASSGFTISVASVEGQKQGHVFYGVNGPNAAPWGASSHYLCVKAPTQRTGTQDSGGTAGACNGSIALDWNAYCATHPTSLGVPFSAGQSVWAQLYFRDPPGPKTTALSNGLTFTVCP